MFNYAKFRKENGVLQKDLAQLLGLTQPGISRYESNYVDPTPSQLKKLCEFYGDDVIEKYKISEDDFEQVKGRIYENAKEKKIDEDLVRVIMHQNETISKQIALYQELSQNIYEIKDDISELRIAVEEIKTLLQSK